MIKTIINGNMLRQKVKIKLEKFFDRYFFQKMLLWESLQFAERNKVNSITNFNKQCVYSNIDLNLLK